MSLLATYKQEIRTKIPNPVERAEWRFTRYGLLTAVKEMTASPESIINTELREKAMASEGRDLKIPVFKIGDVTVKDVRSCVIDDLENTTELVDVVWATMVADISMKKSEHHKNEVSYLEDLNRKLLTVDNAFAKAVEGLIDTTLDTEKSVIYNSGLVGATGSYPLVGGAMQVALAQQEYFFNDLSVIMEEDDFHAAPYVVLGSTGLMSPVTHYINQGAGNDENLQYQFGNYSFRFSNHVTVSAASRSSAYCMPNGSIGLMTRIGIDSELGNKAGDGTDWSKTFMPTLGHEVGVMYKSKCSDLSGQTGLEHLSASMVENWQFSFDVALVVPFNSDPATIAGAIKKFDFLSA